MTTSADRCRNCGLLHKTHTCPSWGPMFPAPGKTKEDYAKLHEKIQNMLAADIIAEHDGDDGDDTRYETPRTREGKYRTVACVTCQAPVGESCVSKLGQPCQAHTARVKAAGGTVRVH